MSGVILHLFIQLFPEHLRNCLQGICNYTSSIKAVFIVFLSDVVGMRNHLLCALAPIVHV